MSFNFLRSEVWKEASVTPIVKKSSSEIKENYRQVSCLPVASKVLEKIVTEQMTIFLEEHKLFPNNQHGFREKPPPCKRNGQITQKIRRKLPYCYGIYQRPLPLTHWMWIYCAKD
jgi:hypothetical protein